MQASQVFELIPTLRLPIYFLFLWFILLSSCAYFQKKTNTANKAIARVDQDYLYFNDVSSLLIPGISAEDSTIIIDKAVNDWIRTRLLITQARNEMQLDISELERKVMQYRYQLILHEYEKFYVSSRISSEVSPDEMMKYYHDMQANFQLKQNIVKCLFTKIPVNAPDVSTFRRYFRDFPDSPIADLKEYAAKYASSSFIEDSVWIDLEELLVDTPWDKIKDKRQFLQNTSFIETRDGSHLYFLKILEYKLEHQVAPLDYVKDEIVSIIVSKRKLNLKKDLHKTLFEDAKNAKRFEIY